MRARAILAAAFVLCTLDGVPRVARAEPAAAESRLARDEAHRGLAAARADRWEEARDAFERAWALSRKPSFLFSLAGAQAKTGRLVEASESYRLLLQPSTEIPPDQRKLARDALAGLEHRLAHLRIVVRGGTREDDAVAVNARPLSVAALAVDLPANPGTHEVTLVRRGSRTAPVTITLHEGESRAVTLVPVVEAAPPPAPAPAIRERSTASPSILRSPWFWTGVGVVVIGGAVAVTCLAGACSSEDPPRPTHQGTLGSAAFP